MIKRKSIKTIIIFTIIFIFICSAVTINAAAKVNIIVNNKTFNADVKVINGTIYLPLQEIGESLGAQVQWNPKTNTVTVVSEEYRVTDVIDKLSNSVVRIIGKIKKSSEYYSSYGDNLVFGSGIIYKSNGYIVTNAHVVADMETIVVVLSNGKSYNARLKAIDELSDLASIKIDKGMLIPAVLGSISDIVVGKPVVAIGTPLSFSLRNSATKGIISGINRSVDGEYRFIQSDAAINGGNSGGPLVNMDGKVIGINSTKYEGYGVEGLNFSIPIDTVKYVLEHFEKYGKVKRPFLGVVFMEGVAARYGLPTEEGLTVSEVKPDTPAAKVGLIKDDVLISVNGINITTKIDYSEEMKKYLPGDSAGLIINRNGKIIKLKVTFDEKKIN